MGDDTSALTADDIREQGLLIYLASPYSDGSWDEREGRFIEVAKIAAKLMADGYLVFSPIAHGHPLARYGELQTGWEHWSRFDTRMIKACDVFAIATIEGWSHSQGILVETKIAGKRKMPIRYVVGGELVPGPLHMCPACDGVLVKSGAADYACSACNYTVSM